MSVVISVETFASEIGNSPGLFLMWSRSLMWQSISEFSFESNWGSGLQITESVFCRPDPSVSPQLLLNLRSTGRENTGGFRPVLLPGWLLVLNFCLVSRADSSGVFQLIIYFFKFLAKSFTYRIVFKFQRSFF